MRYKITTELEINEEESVATEQIENIRKTIEELCNDVGTDIKSRVEDEYCINKNAIADDTLYMITTLEKLEISDKGFPLNGATRTVGAVKTFEEAVKICHNNTCDIFEYLYEYALVEKIHFGLYSTCLKQDRQWFKYDKEKEGFFECDEPTEYEHFCNFAIG